MKTNYLIIFLFFTSLSFSQKLNIKFIEQITKISFLDIEEVMTDGYGFQKMQEEQDGKKIKFAKLPDDNFDNAIVITVLNSKLPINVLDISVGKNFDIQKIKNDLMQNEYLYNGENNYGSWIYEKDKVMFLTSQNVNSMGARQILITYRE